MWSDLSWCLLRNGRIQFEISWYFSGHLFDKFVDLSQAADHEYLKIIQIFNSWRKAIWRCKNPQKLVLTDILIEEELVLFENLQPFDFSFFNVFAHFFCVFQDYVLGFLCLWEIGQTGFEESRCALRVFLFELRWWLFDFHYVLDCLSMLR